MLQLGIACAVCSTQSITSGGTRSNLWMFDAMKRANRSSSNFNFVSHHRRSGGWGFNAYTRHLALKEKPAMHTLTPCMIVQCKAAIGNMHTTTERAFYHSLVQLLSVTASCLLTRRGYSHGRLHSFSDDCPLSARLGRSFAKWPYSPQV